MPINPLNVIQLLLVVFQNINIPDSEVNDAEQQLADHFQEILIQAMNEFNGVEIVEENPLWKSLMQSGVLNLVPEQMKLFVRKTTKMLTLIINKEQWTFGEAEQEKVIVS